MPAYSLDQAYQHCQKITKNHYENFPVASILIPSQLRKPISVIYAFARMADDIADEGSHTDTQRSFLLQQAKDQLQQSAKGTPSQDPIYIAMSDVLKEKPGLLKPLEDLLTAFNMDVDKHRYQDFGEVMQYCRFSANPVGRMLLMLYGADSTKNLAYSDAVCSALQLANFLQDIQSDLTQRGRIYLPADELAKFGINEEQLQHSSKNTQLTAFMHFQTQRVFKLLQSGAPLGLRLKGRIGFELRMMILGGWKVLEKIHHNQGDISLPTQLNKKDWLWIIMHAFSSRFTVYFKKLTQ